MRGRKDELLIKEEKAANAAGARALGFDDAAPLLERVRGGAVEALLVMGHDVLAPAYATGRAALEGVDTLVLLDTHRSPLESLAHVVLPARHRRREARHAHQRRGTRAAVQPAVEPAFEARAEGEVLWRLGQAASACAASKRRTPRGADGGVAWKRCSRSLIKTLFIILVAVAAFAPVITWVERKQSAVMQDRIGANRADIAGITVLGLLHPLADVLKLLTKEDVVPPGANRALHLMAPLIAAIPVIASFGVIPYGGIYHFGDTTVNLVVADLDWGLLYIFAIASIATYGTVIAGWAQQQQLVAARQPARVGADDLLRGHDGALHRGPLHVLPDAAAHRHGRRAGLDVPDLRLPRALRARREPRLARPPDAARPGGSCSSRSPSCSSSPA